MEAQNPIGMMQVRSESMLKMVGYHDMRPTGGIDYGACSVPVRHGRGELGE